MPFEKIKNKDSKTNQLGYKGKEISYSEKDFVVVLVGDSQVESASLPMEAMAESILEDELSKELKKNVKVFTIGSSGWGLDQQLLGLNEYLEKYRADLVIQWSTPVNDLWESTFPERTTNNDPGPIKPTFKLANGKLGSPKLNDKFFLGGNAITQLIYTKFNRYSPNKYISDSWDRDFFDEMLPITDVPECGNALPIHFSQFKPFELKNGQTYNFTTYEKLSKGRAHLFNFITTESKMGNYQKDLGRELYRKMKELTAKKGTNFLIFYPHRELDDALAKISCVTEQNGQTYPVKYEPENLIESISHGIDFVRASIKGRYEIAISPDDAHLNELGNRRAMLELTNKLIEKKHSLNLMH